MANAHAINLRWILRRLGPPGNVRFGMGTRLSARDHATPSLARTGWEHISRVLADHHGNISETAYRLGIQRHSLQRKLQKYRPRR